MESADAVIAVSEAMGRDILAAYPRVEPGRVHVIHNGIDPDEYRRDDSTDVLGRLGIDPARPMVMFLGRVTRQKGIVHLIDAAARIDPDAQMVLCAGAPDTPEIGAEVREKVAGLRRARGGVFWIEEMLPRSDVVQLLSHAAVFVCPSVYEPFGLINLEAMACGLPVVASAVGGIPEIVVDGETGYLVAFDAAGDVFGSPVIRSASPPISPIGSTTCSPTPGTPATSARPGDGGSLSTSAGGLSPLAPPSFTTGCSGPPEHHRDRRWPPVRDRTLLRHDGLGHRSRRLDTTIRGNGS